LRDLDSTLLASLVSPVTQSVCSDPKPTIYPRQQNLGGTRANMGPQCYNCASPSHLIRQCPYPVKGKYSETPRKTNSGIGKVRTEGKSYSGNVDNKIVSSITPTGQSTTLKDQVNGKHQ